jgi:hypothetical protein
MTYIGWCGTISDLIEQTGPFVLLFGVLLVFSIISLFVRLDVFRSWAKFVVVYLPVAIFTILATPVYGSGGGLPGQIAFVKIVDAFLASLIFVIVSAIIMVAKPASLKKGK